MSNTMSINAQNRSEMGLGRNDFYEYKKNRIVDLVSNGAGVADIANDLGLGEKDVYSFISRNFGGLRNLKAMLNSGEFNANPAGVFASAPKKIEGAEQTKKGNGQGKRKRNNQKVYKSPVAVADTDISVEKQKIIDEFKNSIDRDMQVVISEVQTTLNGIKRDLLAKFKMELMNELSAMAKSL